MPTQTFNLGRDRQVVFNGPFGLVDLGLVSEFSARQITDQVTVKPMNTPPQFADLPAGWEGEFTIERSNANADNLIAAMEAAFWTGGSIGVGSMYEYMQEVDGSLSTFQYAGVTVKLDAGNSQAEQPIKQKLSWRASIRTRI